MLAKAFPYFLRFSNNQVQRKRAIHAPSDIERLFYITLVMGHDDQQIDVAILGGNAVRVGAK